MARLILPPYGKGPVNEGERRAVQFLENNLPPLPPKQTLDAFGDDGPEYVVIPNIEIPDSAHRFLEIDAVIIAPHAVYVMEVKDWGSVIEGNDHVWYLNNRIERKNPHRTLHYKCQVLRSIIGDFSPDLFTKVWYQGVVAIARDNVILDFEGNCRATSYPLDRTLAGYLKDPMYLSTPKKVATDAIVPFQKELVNIILNKGRSRQEDAQIIGEYAIEETLFIQDDLAEYIGCPIHGKKRQKRLRVFKLPLYKNPDERKQLEERIRRDYEALEIIGTHPNVVGLRGFFTHEDNQLVQVLDWAEEGTLRTLISKGTLTLDQKLAIVAGIAAGLKAAHEKDIIHRDLRPENVLMAAAGPQIMNFDRAYVEAEGYETVWTRTLKTEDRRYLPPELALPMNQYDMFNASDLYSLGAIFYEMLCGYLPFSSPEDFQQAGGELKDGLLPTQNGVGVPDWVDEVVPRLYVCDVKKRYDDVAAFLKDFYKKSLSEDDASTSSFPTPEIPEEPSSDPNRIYKTGERIGEYRITRYISGGGYADVYQATHVLHDKEYALKINRESVPLEALIDEFRYLDRLRHPNIVKVNWSGQLPGGRYYIAMEFLKGETLKDYAWGAKRLTAIQVLEVGKDVLAALRYLHEGQVKSGTLVGKPLYHRDIKPNNIVWTDRGFVLIDFNIAKEAQKSRTFAGTSPYLAPDMIEGLKINWNDSGDTFALGVTLYELMCKTHPYPNKEPLINKKPVHPHALAEGEDLSQPVADFLFKAVQPLADDRFNTARDMEAALQKVLDGPLYKVKSADPTPMSFRIEDDEKGLKNYNPFVKRLCRLFSQARHSNAGTRGLDEVGRCTYIPTRLDEELIPSILDGRHRLVIITGNAGDGKTAFIQQLEARAENVQRLSSKNGARFDIRGIPFESNYDGSQDEGDISNDEVLSRFLSPFAGLDDFASVPEGRILAINEGRLMEFLGAPERIDFFGGLYEIADRYFNERGDVALPPGMVLLNLNWRSIVAETQDQPSILEKQLKALLKDELWRPCETCDYAPQCFIYYNARSLGDPAAGPEIRNRLSHLFETVHLRRQLHITMRDLRSALSFLICRDRACLNVPDMIQQADDDGKRMDYIRLAYWNITEPASDSGGLDRLIRLLRRIDIGKVAVPEADRDIHFLPSDLIPMLELQNRQQDFTKTILDNIRSDLMAEVPAEKDEFQITMTKFHHALMIRKLFFEGRSMDAAKRLPYRYLTEFQQVIQGDAMAGEEARKILIQAVSVGEGCRNRELAENYVCIAASPEKDHRWATFRLFPQAEFEIHVPDLGRLTRYLEYTQDRFILRHKENAEVVLEVNLDLFELLYYVARGFTPSLNDLYGRYIELIIFKNTLQHLPYRSVVVTKDHRLFHRIYANARNEMFLEKM